MGINEPVTYICNRLIGITVTEFASSPGDRGSIIPKTKKMVLDASLLNTQYYNVLIKCKVK